MKKNVHIPICCLLAFVFCLVNVYAQSGALNAGKRPHDWWLADWKNDSIPGISLDKAYNYLKGRKSKPPDPAACPSGPPGCGPGCAHAGP